MISCSKLNVPALTNTANSLARTIFRAMLENDQTGHPRFSSIIGALPPSIPFVAPEALERARGTKLHLRLGANESAFGVSPLAVTAMRAAAIQSHWYGDPENHDLRVALATSLCVGVDNLVVGNGIDGLLGYVVRAIVDPGDAVVTSHGTYPTFNYHVAAYGGIVHAVPYLGDRPNLDAMLESVIRTQARLVYLANPDNPSGSWHQVSDIARFVSDLPDNCTLVLDEAYFEFSRAATILPVDISRRSVVRVRTFSKAHGMAGARIGYAIAHSDFIATLGKFRNQFEVSRVSQAGALASLADADFVRGVIRSVEDGRREYETLASALGCSFIPSATNFVCFDVGGVDRARAIVAALLERGVFIRMPGAPPLNRCIRVTVGTPQERAEFADILREVMSQL